MVRWSSLILPIVIAIIALLVALGTGVGIAYAVFEPPTSQARAQVEERGARIGELEANLQAKDQRIEELLSVQGGMKQELAGANVQLEDLKTKLREEETLVQQARADTVSINAIYPNALWPKLQRELAQHKESGGLWNAVCAKTFARINRLFGYVIKQLATTVLFFKHMRGGFGKCLMGKEIQLKTFAQQRVVQHGHFTSPGNTRI